MDESAVMDIVIDAMWTAARVSAPILLTAVLVGVFVGLLQSVTQIQEQTLSFVPKFAAVGVAIAVSGGWMLQTMITFTRDLIDGIPGLL
ncbi:MAG: flagellar biosynthesis protein FliQ [Acidimicrobiales bacterium]